MGIFALYCKIIYFLSVFHVLKSASSTNVIGCVNNFKDIESGKKTINPREYCQARTCISKCCRSANRILYYNGIALSCNTIELIMKITNKTISIDYDKIVIYKSNLDTDLQKSNSTFKNSFQFVLNKKMTNDTCVISYNPDDPILQNYKILENGTLIYARTNFYTRFPYRFDFGDFCMEHIVIHNVETNTVRGPFLTYKHIVNLQESTSIVHDVLIATAMLISLFFLILVLCVYGVLPELKNLGGLIVMAYVSTLSTTFLFKAIELLGSRDEEKCKGLGVFLYFTIISSFSWMCIMSMDLWWNFRGIYKDRRINRRGVLVKFGVYGLYAWGIPLLLTIAVGVIDYTDLPHHPFIFKPHFELCFFTSDAENDIRFYLYIPILLILILNWIFFLMTAFNIWRIKRGIGQFKNKASNYNQNQNRFSVYIKLSLIMGISWVLEIISLPTWMQAIATTYNCLIGVAIFFIFVFKRKILLKLCKRFSIQSQFVENLQRKTSNFTHASETKDRTQSAIEMEESTKVTDL